MQIAKVVPKVKTSGNGIFDYSIPPEILPDIKCGVLVEVSFHNRNIEAIVIDIKRTSQIDVLKPILKIIDSNPVIDETHLKLAQWMSDYYMAPLGLTLFSNIVPPAKRKIKNFTLGRNPSLNAINKNSKNKFLILADFSRRLNFYHQAIEKTIKRNQSVIIIIPDLSLTNHFLKKIKNVIILNAELTKTERWLAWNKIRESSHSIVIGSNSALFAPVRNLGLIIVDQIENPTYKNDRTPRFSVTKTAEKLSKLTSANLIFGTLTPDVETYFLAQRNFKIFQHKFNKSEIEICDITNEKQILSETLKNKIAETLRQNKKVIVLFNRKGEGNFYNCFDCGWNFKCPECDLSIKPFENTGRCSRCEIDYKLPQLCPKCNGQNMKTSGFGTKRLAGLIKKIWPKAKVVNIEKDGDKINNDFDIAVVTTYALKFNLPKINLVAIINADTYMNFPSYRSAEDAFNTNYKFLKIGSEGLIQTSHPNDYFITSLASLDYAKFVEIELKNRYQNSFPPYSKIINLIYQNKSEEVSQKSSEKLVELLKNIKNSDLEILGPNPAFIYKKRDQYRWQIILKIKGIIPIKLKEILLKQKDWIIDVDPIDTI